MQTAVVLNYYIRRVFVYLYDIQSYLCICLPVYHRMVASSLGKYVTPYQRTEYGIDTKYENTPMAAAQNALVANDGVIF